MKLRTALMMALTLILTTSFARSTEWQIEQILDHAGIGSECDLEIDSSGGLHVSFENRHGYLGSSSIMYGFKGDDLALWQLQNVDSNPDGYTGYDNEIALDIQELPRIVYVWDRDWDYVPFLKHAWFDGELWHDHQLTTYDEYVQRQTSIAIDQADYSHLFYGDWYGAGPLHHRWEDETGWNEEVITTGGSRAPHAVIDGDDRIHLLFYASGPGAVQYALNEGDGWVLTTIEIDTGVYDLGGLDMVLDAAGYPHLAYRGSDREQRHAWFDGAIWQIEVIHDNALGYPSIAIDQWGAIHMCYSVYTAASNRPLTYSVKSPGGEWVTEEIENDVQCWNTAMDIDPTGRPHIIYYNYSGGITKHAWGSTSTGLADLASAGGIRLYSAYPNPAPGRSSIAFELPNSAQVELVLYDIKGRRVETLMSGARSRGRHVAQTGDLAGGIYLVRLRADGETRTGKLVVLAGDR